MKVSSPVGDLPFEVTRLRWKSGAIVLEGAMGAWPSKILIYPRDALKLLRLLGWPLAILCMIIVAAVLLMVID
jgi:hypothetical protein